MTTVNASWTLKCDLTCEYVCRLLNHMEKTGQRQCMPRKSDPSITEEPFASFTSGYIQRSVDKFPKQGSKRPWRLHQNYALDLVSLKYSRSARRWRDGCSRGGSASAEAVIDRS